MSVSEQADTAATQQWLYVVQFLHPGGEHRADADGVKRWNVGRHQRKFLVAPGKAIRGTQVIESDLVFWGEWEAESQVVEHFSGATNGEPEYLWRPCFTQPTTYRRLQNTDPFVFQVFLYGICQQYRKTGPTRLRNLGRGSVILFGSSVGGSFVVDTVFVVKDWIDHTRSTYADLLRGRVPDRYVDVTIKPLYESQRNGPDACARNDGRSWRLYLGATYDDPVEGMLSFFPCLPRSSSGPAFRRPRIDDQRIVTATLQQGFRLNPQSTVGEVVELWRSFAGRVQKDFWLGIHVNMPDHVPAAVARLSR